MKTLKHILPLALLVVALSSCLTSKKVNLLQEPGKDIPSYADTVGFEDYRIRIDDRLYIQVYSVDENLTKLFNQGSGSNYNLRQQMMGGQGDLYGTNELYSYLVDHDGNIQYPMIGNVHVHGLTTREVKRLLEDELAGLVKKIGNYSLMSVEVQVISRFFSVIGAVQSARVPLMKEKVNIYEALALAGDIADYGDHSKIRIIREIEGVTTIRTFDVRSKDIINSEFFYIEPNDVIYIQYMPGHTFGINHVTTTIAVVATTISFGAFLYALVTRTINAVQRSQNNSSSTSNSGGK